MTLNPLSREELKSFDLTLPFGKKFKLARRLFGFTEDEWSNQVFLPAEIIRKLERTTEGAQFMGNPYTPAATPLGLEFRDPCYVRSLSRAAQVVWKLFDLAATLKKSNEDIFDWIHSPQTATAGLTPFKVARTGGFMYLLDHIQRAKLDRIPIDYGPDDQPCKPGSSIPWVPPQSPSSH